MLEYVFLDTPSQLRIDFVSYASQTTKVQGQVFYPQNIEHGDIGLVDNSMSSHRVLVALLVFATLLFEMVTK